MKQLDSHLCDLDRRIEKHISSRAKARAEGNFELIALEQNRLAELCVEHKQRLDSMLFLWVLGGFVSIAAWARAAGRSNKSLIAPHPPDYARVARMGGLDCVDKIYSRAY